MTFYTFHGDRSRPLRDGDRRLDHGRARHSFVVEHRWYRLHVFKLLVFLGVVVGVSAGMTRSVRQRNADKRSLAIDVIKSSLAALEERRMEGAIDEHAYRRAYDALMVECGRQGFTLEELGLQ